MTLQQPGLTVLAKQGDVTAIAALMNRSLQSKGIVARVAHQKGHLRVLLEGQTVPDQNSLAPYIRKGVLALQISGVHTLSVWGRSKGTSTPAWSDTFALNPANTELNAPQIHSESVKPGLKQTIDRSDPPAEDHPATSQQSHTTDEQDVTSVANPEAIAAHLNQAMATDALVFEAVVDDRSLKLTAKTNQILQGDTFAKDVQNHLLPLNLADIDTVHLYKQKTNGNSPYKIKAFTLYREPAPTEAATTASEPLHPTEDSAAQSQPARSQSIGVQQTKITPQAATQASQKSKFLLIALVALVLVLLIGGIKLLAKPPAATEICQDTAGAPGYCQLAVQLVGEQSLHDLKTAATPFTPEMEAKGLSLCENATDLQMRRKPVRQGTRYSHSLKSEPVFPGITMVDTQLKASPQANVASKASPQAEVTVFRTACLFAGNDDRVQLIKNVVLPNGWPEEPYQGKQEWEPMQRSLKVYQIALMLGGGTLFTAIGLFAACSLNLGVQIYTLRGLFQTASILGTLDTLLIVMSGGKLNLFGGVPLTCLALGLTQIWVNDLRVDWAAGYRIVALGVFVMMIIRIILNWLLLGFIFSVL